MKILDTFEFLLGRWSVDRSFEDIRNDTRGSFQGSALFVEFDAVNGADCCVRAKYAEEGQLRIGDQSGPAFRRLEYSRRNDSTVMLYFVDGKPFVDLDLTGGDWLSRHLCGNDRYEITTVAKSHDVIQERWYVEGPTKKYAATTTLTRLDG